MSASTVRAPSGGAFARVAVFYVSSEVSLQVCFPWDGRNRHDRLIAIFVVQCMESGCIEDRDLGGWGARERVFSGFPRPVLLDVGFVLNVEEIK